MSPPAGGCVRDNSGLAGMRLIASVFNKPGRRHGVAEFLPTSADDVWLWAAEKEITAALIARRLRFEGGTPSVAFGCICTAAHLRKAGFASALVKAVCQRYQKEVYAMAILWAGAELLGFYQRLGFISGFQDEYCEVRAVALARQDAGELNRRKLDACDHAGFEQLRLQFARRPAAGHDHGFVLRTLTARRWEGINPGFPWCPQLEVVFAGTETAPGFYGVVGHGEGTATILEFVGNATQFGRAVAWAQSAFPDTPVKYNATAPELLEHLNAVEVVERQPSLFSMRCPLAGPATSVPPLLTWLDRV